MVQISYFFSCLPHEASLLHMWDFKGENIEFFNGKFNVFTLKNFFRIAAKLRTGGVKQEKSFIIKH